MNTNSCSYAPISCEFHDRLEDIATARKLVNISFIDATGADAHRSTTILDVYARDGAEYLAMGSGETIRLDRLLEVEGERLPSD
ncbi:hypothetical protein [Dyella sp. C11]|uniref:hypothetical protein n=1 Tax=Dyella sp. C11 TaxID=2126991 RepID=UPI000D65014A|nr:hypothetical protein [Dyella sp. C11]